MTSTDVRTTSISQSLPHKMAENSWYEEITSLSPYVLAAVARRRTALSMLNSYCIHSTSALSQAIAVLLILYVRRSVGLCVYGWLAGHTDDAGWQTLLS